MKNYSSSRVQKGKGKTAYRTPSRWLANKPEQFKKEAFSKLKKRGQHFWPKSSSD